jgi:serine/threonine protein kinase/predicted ATPase/Tfp pilus assembly protein PilF
MRLSPSRVTEADLPISFGRYELLEIIGEGGMGRVFRARLNGPAGFRKEVAVKVIIGGAETIPVYKRDQLAHEARLGGLLRHPNIVDTYELGEDDDGMFIAMELIEGISLSKLIAREQGLPVACSLDILLQVAAALDHAHNLNVGGQLTPMVHRDLKPGNLLVDRTGMVKITDFGISILRMQGGDSLIPRSITGTLRYMSPEQVTGAPMGIQSDLFSIGIVAYEMLTGRRLFPKLSPDETADLILLEEFKFKQSGRFKRLEALQPGLGPVIFSCLRRKPEDRIRSAAQLFEHLRALRIQSPGESLPQILPRHVAGARMLHMPLAPMGAVPTNPLSEPHHTSPAETRPTETARITNVPTDTGHLYGREDLLKQIRRQFKKKARLVTLKGPGGIGKTSVAIHYLVERLEDMEGGCWFFDLTPARDRRSIVQIVAKELELPLGQGDLDACVQQVGRCIGNRSEGIYLFDNVEQVADQMANTIGIWMAMAPDAKFVATSRERLHLPDERVLEVEPLEERVALELFRNRARSMEGGEAPDKKIAKQIIPHLEGNPLAIELAAARAMEMGAEALLHGLSERFAVLSSQGGRPNRQATLRATIDWSWNLLEPWEQSTLAQLSIFRGGFTMESADAILWLQDHPGAPWLLDIIQSLLDRSLLRANQGKDQPRFGLYESVREYAAEKLDVDHSALETRFISHFAEYGQAQRQVVLRAGGAEARRMLDELENLFHAFDLAILHEHEEALSCFTAVYDALERLGPITRIQALAALLQAQALSPADSATVSLKECYSHIVCGNLEQAKKTIKEAMKIAEHWGDETLAAEGLLLRATVQMQEGKVQEAIKSGKHGIQLATNANQPRLVALTHAIVGRAYRMAGQYTEAGKTYRTATKISRRLGDQSLLASNLGNEGTIAMMEGRLSDAAKLFGQSLSVAANTGDRRIQAVRIFQLGTALLEAGELDSALGDYRAARKMFQDFGERFNESMVLVGISQVLFIQEDYVQARELLFECLVILKEIGSEARAGIALTNLGEIEIAMGEFESAQEHLMAALDITENMGMIRIAAAAHSALGLLYLRQGKQVTALEELEIAESTLRGINEPIELGKLLCNQAELHLVIGQEEKAREYFDEIKLLAVEIKTSSASELGRRMASLASRMGEEAP